MKKKFLPLFLLPILLFPSCSNGQERPKEFALTVENYKKFYKVETIYNNGKYKIEVSPKSLEYMQGSDVSIDFEVSYKYSEWFSGPQQDHDVKETYTINIDSTDRGNLVFFDESSSQGPVRMQTNLIDLKPIAKSISGKVSISQDYKKVYEITNEKDDFEFELSLSWESTFGSLDKNIYLNISTRYRYLITMGANENSKYLFFIDEITATFITISNNIEERHEFQFHPDIQGRDSILIETNLNPQNVKYVVSSNSYYLTYYE